MPEQKTVFTVDKIESKGAHVHFSLYANGAKTGDLVMTKAEYKLFQASLLDPSIHTNTLEVGKMIGHYQVLVHSGWRVLSLERLMYWKNKYGGYVHSLKEAGDFTVWDAIDIANDANVALHSDRAKKMGAEELLVYVPPY